MKHAIKNIHFIGLGGAGMSGIAEVLHNLGYVVSGSDLADSATLRRLADMGIKTFVGHAAQNLESVDAVAANGPCPTPAPTPCCAPMPTCRPPSSREPLPSASKKWVSMPTPPRASTRNWQYWMPKKLPCTCWKSAV